MFSVSHREKNDTPSASAYSLNDEITGRVLGTQAIKGDVTTKNQFIHWDVVGFGVSGKNGSVMNVVLMHQMNLFANC